MRSLIVLGLLAMVALTSADYAHKLENYDIDALLADKGRRESLFKCLVDEGPCTAEGQEINDLLQESYKDMCKKCSMKQIAIGAKTAKYLLRNDKATWRKIVAKLDPDRKLGFLYEALEAAFA